MKKILPASVLLVIILLIFGCEKERTITSTEYIHEIEYVEGPTDTVFVFDTLFQVDTLFQQDSITVNTFDTIIIVDTLFEFITDTLAITEYINDTIVLFDTVTIVENIYDTIYVIDTVVTFGCPPYVHFAFASMPYYTDQQVIDFINAEFGYSNGWIYYLSLSMTDVSSPSDGVYNFYGYVNYWTPNWSAYCPLVYYWRMTFLGGDPSDPDSWQLSDPPTGSSGKIGGLRLSTEHEASVPGN